MAPEGLLPTELGYAEKTGCDLALVERSGVLTMIYVFSDKATQALSGLCPSPKEVESEAHSKVFALPLKLEETKKYLQEKFGEPIVFC